MGARASLQPLIAMLSLTLVLAVATQTSRAATAPASAPQRQPLDLETASAVVSRWVDEERVPGAVLLVSHEGRVVLEQAYGWAARYEYREGEYGAAAAGESRPSALRVLDDPRPMTTDTRFDLASVTKVMATTFAAMLLVDAGELALDDPVSAYLSDFRDNAASAGTRVAEAQPQNGAETQETGAGKQGITIRHLLTHRAGLHQWQPIYYHAEGPAEAYEYIRDLPLSWAVGEGRHYSDLGFMLLGLVVEQISGAPLEDFLAEQLYEPLGLTATGFRPAEPRGIPLPAASLAATSHGNPYEHRMVHDPEFGYRYAGDADSWDGWRRRTLAGEVNDGNAFHAFGGVAGHAGLFSTAADLQVLLQLLLNRGEFGGRRYLRSEVVDEFLATTGDGQALGWQLQDDPASNAFSHPGFTGTYVVAFPDTGVAIVLLTNRQNAGLDARGGYPDIGDLQREVTAAITGR